jgi:NCAIR mutase (PurE)-related protein
MTPSQLRELLEDVRLGRTETADACGQILNLLRQPPLADLGFARVDHHRAIRQGFPEVVLGSGKSPEQIVAIAKTIVDRGETLLVTRTTAAVYEEVRAVVPDAIFHPDARVISCERQPLPQGHGTILVIAAGTSDLAVAEEAAVTAKVMGNAVERLYDVGVSGLHRLLSQHERLNAARVIIVAAGMEGALPSVVAGLVHVPVLAVPTSVGYGASFGGLAALLAMLNSCASGVSVVNIDNGFGAATVASLINHL